MTHKTHFAVRAEERASVENAAGLFEDLRIALSDPDRWTDYIEPVKDLKNGAMAYRFRISTGIFYAVTRDGFPITIFTQEQMRNKKWSEKTRRAGIDKNTRLRKVGQHKGFPKRHDVRSKNDIELELYR